MKNKKFIDLSMSIRNSAMEPQVNEIDYHVYDETARERAKKWSMRYQDFPTPGNFIAYEIVKLSSHSGTHMDSPYHYGPTCEGGKPKTIDEIPLEWCFNDGVVLDFSNFNPEDLITKIDIEKKLQDIDYKIKPLDIVLIRTDASKYSEEYDYDQRHTGLSRDAVFCLTEKGVKIIGIDGWGMDSPTDIMVRELKKGNRDRFYPAPMAGRDVEYLHVEKLTNLDLLPDYSFKVSVFPIKIARGSGGWVRAVAIIEE